MDGNTSEVIIAAILGGGTMITAIVFGALNTWKMPLTVKDVESCKELVYLVRRSIWSVSLAELANQPEEPERPDKRATDRGLDSLRRKADGR